MRKVILVFVAAVISLASYSQVIYKIKTDSLLVTNDSCNAELNLENSTRNVNGFLYNKGNGRTEFRKGLIKVNDSIYIIGADTLNLAGVGTSSAWNLNGNTGTNPTNNFLGTTDANGLAFRTNNIVRASI